MKVRYERSVSHAAQWSRRLGLFALALFVFTAVLHRFGFLEAITFAATFALSGVIALLALLLALWGIFRLWLVGAVGGMAAFKGLLMAMAVLIPSGLVLYRASTLPRIYDITTNVEEPPGFLQPVSHESEWLIADFMTPAGPYAGQTEAYPLVTGRRYEGAVDRILQAVRLVAEKQGLKIVETLEPQSEQDVAPDEPASETDGESEPVAEAEEGAGSIIEVSTAEPSSITAPQNEEEATEALILGPLDVQLLLEGAAGKTAEIVIQAETRTLVWGLESDISIRLTEEAQTTFVDMRSVSRFGPHDFGVNAQIITRFLNALDAELLGIAVR
ncbi:DUF1499 domain-containing protein [Hoeflea sp. CAU 1731]